MNLKTIFNGKDITITLTKEQIAEITKQTSNIKTIDDINSYEDAVNILGELIDCTRSKTDELFTIIRAANYIDNNNKEWKTDFLDKNTYKYIPYFKRKTSGWLLCSVSYYYCTSDTPFGFYYKLETSANIISKRFNTLYNQVLG